MISSKIVRLGQIFAILFVVAMCDDNGAKKKQANEKQEKAENNSKYAFIPEKIFKLADLNGDERLDFEEFVQGDPGLQHEFYGADLNHDRKIGKDEWPKHFEHLEKYHKNWELPTKDDLWKSADIDKNEQLSLFEFGMMDPKYKDLMDRLFAYTDGNDDKLLTFKEFQTVFEAKSKELTKNDENEAGESVEEEEEEKENE